MVRIEANKLLLPAMSEAEFPRILTLFKTEMIGQVVPLPPLSL